MISYREGGRERRSFGVPALRLPPPARSCRARCLLNGALRWWQRTQHHRFPFSRLCSFGQWPMRSTAMARMHEPSARHRKGKCQQRGHVSPPVAALGGNGTSPLYPVRCSVASVSGHGGVPPCPGSTRLSRGVRGFCSVRPLRPHASLLHNAAFCKVQGSRCAKAPLGAPHRFAPFRVYKTGVMQSGLR